MALTPEQVTGLRDAMGQVTADMTEYLLRDAARRIAEAGKMTSSSAYELYRSQALGAGQRALKKELKRLLGLSWQKIWQLFEDAAAFSHQNDTGLVGVWASDAQSEILERMTLAAVRLAEKDFTNLTQTLGMVAPDGKAYPLRTFYRKTMDFAFEQVFTGAADYQTAIRQATAKMAGQGVVTIDYESGVHTSLEAAVRRSMMGGMGLLDEQITKADHDEFGCNGWEISAHAASAPDHEPYQGRQYSDAQYEALNAGLARRIGTLNCGHVAFPILLGVNEPQYSEAELEELRQDNARGITYEGRHYTKYEATQKQRQLERAQRLQKRRYLAADAAGDTEAARTAAVRLQALRGQYARFSKAAGLRTQAERIEVSGFGRKQAAGAVQAAKKADAAAAEYQYRKTRNTGVFSEFEEQMSLKHVRGIVKDMGIQFPDTKLVIVRDKELIGRREFMGYTFPDGSMIHLYPAAFSDREQLVKTLGHEYIHLKQAQERGMITSVEELMERERDAYDSEQGWWDDYCKKTGFGK